MSRARDLVDVKMGNVRVPVSELSTEERVFILKEFGCLISGHYQYSRGGRMFVPWNSHLLISEDGVLKNLSGLRLPRKLQAQGNKYHANSRIAVLAHGMFDMPGCTPDVPRRWRPGARIGACRLCLTQDGELWFEWYEATVDKHLNAVADTSEFNPVHFGEDAELPKKLELILSAHPSLLSSFGYTILELIHVEALNREERAAQTRSVSNRLAMFGSLFDITLV